jgi:phage tail tape-measure protein
MLGGEELWFTKNQSLGVNVSNLRDSLSEARESGLYNYEADIDFDATILSVDELKEKLRDLYRLRNANLVEGFLGENASSELNTLIEALEKAEQTRQSVENIGQATDENGNAVTTESFLAMGKD